MKHNFKVGDKVRIKPFDEVSNHAYLDREFWKFYGESNNHVISKIEIVCSEIRVHTNGWEFFWPVEALEPVFDKHELIVYSKGPETVAVEKVNGEVVKKAVAKCSPSDEYKWETGQKLALMRLLEEEKPEENPLYNGKVVCTCCCGACLYTVGKIYEFKNGVSYDDDQNRMTINGKPVKNFKEWNEYSMATWLEIVE